MPLLREPLVVFIALFLLCLLAVAICFRKLESAAIIVRKDYQLGGAIAGFRRRAGGTTVRATFTST